MATALENLITRRETICAELAVLTNTSGPGGKPNANAANSLDHVGYKDGLYRELRDINAQISQLEGGFDLQYELDT